MNTTNTTLFAGRTITVTHEDNSTEEIKVRQIPLRDYERAAQLLDDEIALAAFACDKPKEWLTGPNAVTPESYELLRQQVQEVNAGGFFSYAARRQQRATEEQERMVGMMATMSPEALKMAAQLGSASNNTSPTPRPR